MYSEPSKAPSRSASLYHFPVLGSFLIVSIFRPNPTRDRPSFTAFNQYQYPYPVGTASPVALHTTVVSVCVPEIVGLPVGLHSYTRSHSQQMYSLTDVGIPSLPAST